MFFCGVNLCVGFYQANSEFSGTVDSLKNSTYFTQPYTGFTIGSSIEEHPFEIRRNDLFIKSSAAIYAGFEFFFTKRFSFSVGPTFSHSYYYIYKTSTAFSGEIEYPAQPSKSFTQIAYENFLPYLTIHF